MPTIIMTRLASTLDGSVRGKAMTFLQRLGEDDTTPGLHVEPINGSADPRVRTGRVDQFWRAVLFRLDAERETHYLVHGIWPHDDAIKVAKRAVLRINPVNGLPRITDIETQAPPLLAAPSPSPSSGEELTSPAEPLLARLGRTRDDLVDRLGLPAVVAVAALAAPDEDSLVALAEQHEGWVGLMLVDLAVGEDIDTVLSRLHVDKPVPAEAGASEGQDADVVASLRRPAAQSEFVFIEDQDELRRVIEAGDFGAWRVFLHPEQRMYAERSFNGPFRLTGGAGTGKTVVLAHRARSLARRNPNARVILTTYTRNLADAIADAVTQLDPELGARAPLGGPSIHVAGVDALAAAVIRSAGAELDDSVVRVLGDSRSDVGSRPSRDRWSAAIASAGAEIPAELANETFLAAEYALVVVPNRLVDEAGYLRVRRAGRGVALDRSRRALVWGLVEAYRAIGRMQGGLDYVETAAVAAEHLDRHQEQRPADHILVDEGQDLTPSHWQLVRSLVPEGRDDIFLVEDAHQRIYGPRVVLSRYGIRVVGRSRRLTLNYRTTAQNLRFALTMLSGFDYSDLEDHAEAPSGYRSARSGPPPVVTEASLVAGLGAVVQHVRAWLADGTSPGTVAVLVPDQYQRDRVVANMTEAGLPATSVNRDRPPADKVAVMTRHRAKGTEFAKVIMTDVGYTTPAERARLDAMDAAERLDAELRSRSLMYVGATRARDELVVIKRSTGQ